MVRKAGAGFHWSFRVCWTDCHVCDVLCCEVVGIGEGEGCAPRREVESFQRVHGSLTNWRELRFA